MASNALNFYSIAAQVIPVLFIALAFETRAFGRIDREAEQDVLLAGIRLYAFILMVWGEAAALGVLSTERPSAGAHEAITNALIAEAVVLSLEPVIAFLRAVVGAIPARFERYTNSVLRGMILTVGVALVLLGVVQVARTI